MLAKIFSFQSPLISSLLFFLLGCCLLQFSISSAKALPPPAVEGASVIVVDANNGHVLCQRNADEPRSVGSTQKLLTALIVVENGGLDQRITIAPIDVKTEPTVSGVRPGESYTRRELLNVMLVKSTNDLARAFARDQAGSLTAFSDQMNEKAAALGATSSHFITPNGLTVPGQYATARDMARIGLAAYHNPTIRDIVRQRQYCFRHADGKVDIFKNTNFTLHHLPYCNGMKTGYTVKSRHCLISSGSYKNRDVVVVVLGSSKHIFDDSGKLLAWSLGAPLPVEKVSCVAPRHRVSHRRRRVGTRVRKTA